ncbi:MAG: DUF2214 family protein [Undibacterium sp.]|nr:DUF2214 family protein [Undibacterium sp.]
MDTNFWGFFITKTTVFAVLGLRSIYPIVHFLKWRKTLKQNRLPILTQTQTQTIKGILLIELFGIALIVLHAIMTAKGFSYL